MVQDFFHQQYLFITESWNTIFVSAFFWQTCKADRIQLLPAANRFWCSLFRWFSWNSWTFDQCVYLSYVGYAYSAYMPLMIYLHVAAFGHKSWMPPLQLSAATGGLTAALVSSLIRNQDPVYSPFNCPVCFEGDQVSWPSFLSGVLVGVLLAQLLDLLWLLRQYLALQVRQRGWLAINHSSIRQRLAWVIALVWWPSCKLCDWNWLRCLLGSWLWRRGLRNNRLVVLRLCRSLSIWPNSLQCLVAILRYLPRTTVFLALVPRCCQTHLLELQCELRWNIQRKRGEPLPGTPADFWPVPF